MEARRAYLDRRAQNQTQSARAVKVRGKKQWAGRTRSDRLSCADGDISEQVSDVPWTGTLSERLNREFLRKRIGAALDLMKCDR